MDRRVNLLLGIFSALYVGAISSAHAADIQELPTVRDSGKFDKALWMRGKIHYSLQLMPVLDPPRVLTLIDAQRVVTTASQPAAQQPPAAKPRIQVWLLRADGSQILPTFDPRFMLYSVPVAEGTQAVAAAIQIDDEYYIEKLLPLEPNSAVQ